MPFKSRAKHTSDNYIRRQMVKDLIFDYRKHHPCVICGEADPIVLEFDHINPKTKKYTLATITRLTTNLDVIIKEIAKCVVICANCHRKKTYYNKDYNTKI